MLLHAALQSDINFQECRHILADALFIILREHCDTHNVIYLRSTQWERGNVLSNVQWFLIIIILKVLLSHVASSDSELNNY
jgi:hemerythrin